jgi:hypothetical protein
MPVAAFWVLLLGFYTPFVLANEGQGVPPSPSAPSVDVCAALISPHSKIAELFPRVTDDQALLMLKANYSELFTWLSQKADATAEGSGKATKGSYGSTGSVSPSVLLFGQDIIEVNRTAVGILALKWILANDYQRFTANQAPSVKLTPQSFQHLRDYILSILKTPEDIDAMTVMILTNDLGKVRRYHELTEKGVGRVIVDHDELLFEGFSQWPETSPNFHRLSASQKARIIDGLRMGSNLNIGQFAQAENLPANLAAVLTLAGKPNEFEFKFIELLLDVAGANGHMDSDGAKVMIEPVYRNFMLARQALLQVIDGHSVRQAYDQILIAKAESLHQLGLAKLDVNIREQRALLRLLTLSRSAQLPQAQLVVNVFKALPKNARAILTAELNVDGDHDGWGILPYYAPALISNALGSLGEVGRQKAFETTFLSLARVLQESRLQLAHLQKRAPNGSRPANGVLTVNVENLAQYVLSQSYKENPDSLADFDVVLVAKPGEENSYSVQLNPHIAIAPSAFPQLQSIAQLRGHRFAVAGIGGGSDVMQAAQLAHMLVAHGKQVAGLLSFRTKFLGSQVGGAQVGAQRVFEGASILTENILKIESTHRGNGRDFEPIAAKDFPTLLALIDGVEDVKDLALRALSQLGPGIDGVILVDTGGDSLFPVSQTADLVMARSTPDQDLQVLSAFGRLNPQLLSSMPVTSVVIAAGVDSPVNAAEILHRAKAQYYSPSSAEIHTIFARYDGWNLNGTSDRIYGKTPYAWQAALRGATGTSVVPLPESAVLSRTNPWNPFVRVPVSGFFVMDVADHLRAIGEPTP